MSGELEKELRGAVAHEKKMGVQGGWMEDLGSLLDTIDALRTELATERAAREKAERERDALREAAKPFQDAAEDIDDDVPDRSEMWEHPASMNVTAGDFRRIAAQWPNGCQDPNSCSRHGQCMYAKCRHEGKSVAALSPSPGEKS